jgi:hypothetical protein
MRLVRSISGFVLMVVGGAAALFGVLSIGTSVPMGVSLFCVGLGTAVAFCAVLLATQRGRR